MYSTRSGLVLGFHGCDKSLVADILLGKISLKDSKNKYDWLGHGVYFWENSPSRALEYAEFLKENPERSKNPIKEPSVIGAVIDLGHCLDLTDYKNLSLLKPAYNTVVDTYKKSEFNIPKNKTVGNSTDLLLRELDCAVIETIHKVNSLNNDKSIFDSVKGVFWEGEELYPNAGFKEKNHIQICVRNPNCIKGYFLPRELNDKFKKI